MEGFKKYLRTNRTMAEIIIFLTGAVMIFVGSRYSRVVVSNVGTSILASAIMVFMTDVLIGNNEPTDSSSWGLEKIYATRGEMNGSCDKYLKKARHIDTIAFGMKSWRSTQQKAIERILKKGGTIRVITMKPGCQNLIQRERDELEPDKNISYSIEQMIEWAKKMNAKRYDGKIYIRYHDHQPQEFVFLMDNRLFAGPYIYGKSSQQTISYEYNTTGGAYEYYKDYFNDLWDNAEFCEDALK